MAISSATSVKAEVVISQPRAKMYFFITFLHSSSDSISELCHLRQHLGVDVVPADDELWRRHDKCHHRTLASRRDVGPIQSTLSVREHGYLQRRQLGSSGIGPKKFLRWLGQS